MLYEIAKKSGAIKKYLRVFCQRYEQLFSEVRCQPLTILEIGIGGYKNQNKGGGSLKMWSEYFPNAFIVGLDCHEKKLNLPSNVIIQQGSQTDIELLERLADKMNGFDIVVDDASHITGNTIISFQSLISYTRLFYIVEDLHMASAKGTRDYFKDIHGADFDTQNLCVIKK